MVIDNYVIKPVQCFMSGINMRCRLEQRTVGMRRDDETILSYVTNTRGITRHVTLIDPDKKAPQTAAD